MQPKWLHEGLTMAAITLKDVPDKLLSKSAEPNRWMHVTAPVWPGAMPRAAARWR